MGNAGCNMTKQQGLNAVHDIMQSGQQGRGVQMRRTIITIFLMFSFSVILIVLNS